MTKKIEDLELGEYFKRKESSKKVWTRQEYDRSEKKYECHDESDISGFMYLKKGTQVYVGFDY